MDRQRPEREDLDRRREGPSGGHLLLLARHSDAVMILARREHLIVCPKLRALQIDLANATIAIDGVLRGRIDDPP